MWHVSFKSGLNETCHKKDWLKWTLYNFCANFALCAWQIAAAMLSVVSSNFGNLSTFKMGVVKMQMQWQLLPFSAVADWRKDKHHHSQHPPHLSFFPPAFIAKHDDISHGALLWPVWVSCPGSVPSQLLVSPGRALRSSATSHNNTCSWRALFSFPIRKWKL